MCGGGDLNPYKFVRPDGFEPPTLWFEARCSIQLSYGRLIRLSGFVQGKKGFDLGGNGSPLWGERRDSNPQQLESQSRDLPLIYAHHITCFALRLWSPILDGFGFMPQQWFSLQAQTTCSDFAYATSLRSLPRARLTPCSSVAPTICYLLPDTQKVGLLYKKRGGL